MFFPPAMSHATGSKDNYTASLFRKGIQQHRRTNTKISARNKHRAETNWKQRRVTNTWVGDSEKWHLSQDGMDNSSNNTQFNHQYSTHDRFHCVYGWAALVRLYRCYELNRRGRRRGKEKSGQGSITEGSLCGAQVAIPWSAIEASHNDTYKMAQVHGWTYFNSNAIDVSPILVT